MIVRKIETGYGWVANCWLLVDEESREAAVVDPGACDERSELMSVVESLGCKIKYILLTHGHFDHILGVYAVREKYGAQVCIHDDDAMCLCDVSKSLAQDFDLAHIQKPVKVDVRLFGGETLFIGSSEIKVMHTPGHTQGGVCYIMEDAKIICSGDTLFCMTVGRTDFAGGSVEQLKQSLTALIALEGDYRILPGHNRETTLDSERKRNIFIRRM